MCANAGGCYWGSVSDDGQRIVHQPPGSRMPRGQCLGLGRLLTPNPRCRSTAHPLPLPLPRAHPLAPPAPQSPARNAKAVDVEAATAPIAKRPFYRSPPPQNKGASLGSGPADARPRPSSPGPDAQPGPPVTRAPVHVTGHSGVTQTQRCIGRGGGTPPPFQGAQPMPSHCLSDAKCQCQWHL